MFRKVFNAIGIFCAPVVKLVNKFCIRLIHPEIIRYIKFVKANYAKGKKCKIKTAYGRGWKNVAIILDKKYVFKFPFASRDRDFVKRVSMTEKRVVDAFRKISPIYIPKMELINWNGMVIRKFEYVSGKQITDFNPKKIDKEQCQKIAQQLANFIWVIQQSDPEELRDLKKNPDEPAVNFRGWMHADLATNFLLDDKFNVVAVIDWEDTYWVDVRWGFAKLNKSLDRRRYYGVFMNTLFDYMLEYMKATCQSKN